jgi:predicted benzoate:H+ symporter BenE
VGVWAQTHRRWIALASLLIVALVFALWNHPTVLTIVLLCLVLLAALALLALLAAGGRATLDAERAPPPQQHDAS